MMICKRHIYSFRFVPCLLSYILYSFARILYIYMYLILILYVSYMLINFICILLCSFSVSYNLFSIIITFLFGSYKSCRMFAMSKQSNTSSLFD